MRPIESAAPATEAAADERPRVLFLCTHNSARSQMAEGMLRAWAGERFEARSAGIEVATVRPEAISVMDELGIDIRPQRSKHVAGFAGQRFDWAITTCDEECAACPIFPGAGHREYWVFDDPAAASGSAEERLDVYRRIRDEIAARIRDFIARA